MLSPPSFRILSKSLPWLQESVMRRGTPSFDQFPIVTDSLSVPPYRDDLNQMFSFAENLHAARLAANAENTEQFFLVSLLSKRGIRHTLNEQA